MMLNDLTDAERNLLFELLEKELRELPAEIHHTAAGDYRDNLKVRRWLVEHLLMRFCRGPGVTRESA